MELIRISYSKENQEISGEIVQKFLIDFQVLKEDEMMGGIYPFGGTKDFETEAEARTFINNILTQTAE